MTPQDRWWDYSGPLSDDPAERVGEPYETAEDDGRDWAADLSPAERALRTLRSLR